MGMGFIFDYIFYTFILLLYFMFYRIIEHRQGIDPEGFCVIVKSKEDEINLIGYFMNLKTKKIYSYYPNEEWIDLSLYYKFNNLKKGQYFCRLSNKGCLFELKNKKNKILSFHTFGGYPSINLSIGKSLNVRLKIHNIISYIYIPRVSLDNSITVDHIDRNSMNNSIINLRFLTKKGQKINTSSPEYHYWKIYNCTKNKLIGDSFNDNDLFLRIRNRTTRSSGYYKGDKILFIDNRIKKIDFNLLIEEDFWIKSEIIYNKGKNSQIYVNKFNGFLKRSNYIFIGTEINTSNDRIDYIIRPNNKVILVSRLVYKTVIDSSFPLHKIDSREINHIDRDSENNSPLNLEVCNNHSENVLKTSSTIKRVHPVEAINIKTHKSIQFNSIKEASSYLKVSESLISKLLRGVQKRNPTEYYFNDKKNE